MAGESITTGWFEDVADRLTALENSIAAKSDIVPMRFVDADTGDVVTYSTEILVLTGTVELGSPINAGSGYKWSGNIDFPEHFLAAPRVTTSQRLVNSNNAGSLSVAVKLVTLDSATIEAFFIPTEGATLSPSQGVSVSWVAIGFGGS